MWLKPGGRPLRFSVVEELAAEEVAFSWRARLRLAPAVSLSVVDSYAAQEGLLEVRLLGILPLVQARGQDVSKGEAVRYLAELPWVPHAMIANRELEWRELDSQTVEVGTLVGSTAVVVQLEFNASGDIVGASCDARPRTEGKTTVPRPWPAYSATTREWAELGFRRAVRSVGNFPTGLSSTGAARSLRSSSILAAD